MELQVGAVLRRRLMFFSLGGLFPGVVFYLSMVSVELPVIENNLANVGTRSGTSVLNASIASPSSSRPRLSPAHSVAS